jgi:hypothetical protein
VQHRHNCSTEESMKEGRSKTGTQTSPTHATGRHGKRLKSLVLYLSDGSSTKQRRRREKRDTRTLSGGGSSRGDVQLADDSVGALMSKPVQCTKTDRGARTSGRGGFGLGDHRRETLRYLEPSPVSFRRHVLASLSATRP